MDDLLRHAVGKPPRGYLLSGCERCDAIGSVHILLGGNEPTHCVSVCLVCKHVGVWDYSIEDWIEHTHERAHILAPIGLPPAQEWPSLDRYMRDPYLARA